MRRLARLGFSRRETVQALLWLPELRYHHLLFRRPRTHAVSFRPLPDTQTMHLFSHDGLQRLLQLYSGGLLSVHDLEQILTYIHAEELAPVDAATLDELLYELLPTYSAAGTPFFTSFPDPAVVQ